MFLCQAKINPPCDRQAVCKKLCDGHYRRRKRGNTDQPLRAPRAGAEVKHGEAGTRLYRIWAGMKQRCTNPKNPAFISYGGRGISVCPEWIGFEGFQSWSHSNGYRDDLCLNRLNNDGNYSLDNCEWTTQKQQTRNTRRSNRITAWGETKTVMEWSEDGRCVVSYYCLRSRLGKHGFSPEEAIALPKGTRKSK